MKKGYLIVILLFSLLGQGFMFSQETMYYDPPQSTYRQALNLFEQKNYGAAKQMFAQFMSEASDPKNSFYENAAYYEAVSSIALSNKDALKKVEHFVTDYPESTWLPKIYFELGTLYYKNRDYVETLDAFEKTSPNKLSKSQRAEYYYKKGYSELSLNRFDAAASSFSEILTSETTYGPAANFYYGHIQYQKGKFDEALQSFKAIEDNKRFNKYVPYYIIHIYYERGDYNKVIEAGNTYMNKADHKTRSEVARLIANSYYNLGDYKSALEYFVEYERSGSKNLSPDEHYRIGYSKFVNEEYRDAISNFEHASEAESDNKQNAWYNLGFCYLNTGQEKFAQNAFLKAYQLEIKPDITMDALYNYVKLTIELGGDLYNDPVTIITDFIEKNPESEKINDAYELLGQLYLASNNYEAALASIEKTKNISPQLQSIYQEIAYTNAVDQFNRGDFENAASNFDKSIKYSADESIKLNALFWKAEGLYRAKDFTGASKLYRDFISSGGSTNSELYPKALYNLAYTYFNQQAYNQAIQYFNQFLKKGGSSGELISDATLRLADSYFILKKYDDASVLYQKAVQSNAKNADYALYQRAFCYGAKGDFNNKISLLTELTQRYKGSYLYDDALYEIASTYLIQNDQRHAIIYFDKLVKEVPNSSLSKKSLVKMGFVYYSNNQYDQAIRALKQVIDKYPASVEAKEALNTLQSVYMDQGKIDEYFKYAKKLDFVQVSTSEEDSLLFTSGENHYMNNDCSKAISGLKNYLQQFPQGGYVLKSYYYLSDCYEKLGDEAGALQYYESIIAFPDNPYTANALIKLARMAYDKEQYSESKKHYQRLADIAEDQGMLVEALDGTMQSSYYLEDFQNAISYAQLLKESGMADDDQILHANYIMAKSYQQSGNSRMAIEAFQIVENLSSNEYGAEAKYELALDAFEKNKLDESESMIYELKDGFSNYPYWVAKGFILLADIYTERGNAFQAEQTLQSIIDNYSGDDLKQVAREKINQLKSSNE
ncbi:MAG: tetratricopeptide repeat protein [Bacteroidetes bacterium]|nr:tetratricopeptide repeat protein [Bacteroidota bacterium]